MARTLSTLALAQILSQGADEEINFLLELSSDGFPALADFPDGVIRLNDGITDLVSNGETFKNFGFIVSFLAETERRSGTTRLIIDNADKWLTQAIDSVYGFKVRAKIKIVLRSTPDTIEAETRLLYLVNHSSNENTVSGVLSIEPILSEPHPAQRMSRKNFPAIS